MSSEVTCTAPVNIAVIKYWGKRDTALLLPTNSSLSLTLSQDHLHSKTTVRLTPGQGSDRLWLNGKEESIAASKRLTNVINETRRVRIRLEEEAAAQGHPLPALSKSFLTICSENNFPTAAGLASSASGFACLTFALSKAFQLPSDNSEISRLARLGSGSACRSLYGGFVAWEMGDKADGSDSIAVQIADESHWPDMEALILVASDEKKDVGSTEGMQSTVETSELLRERIREVVPRRMSEITKAILEKDFNSFAEITMKDSNQFHAVCLDTFPPIFYLTDVSKGVISLITNYNKLATNGTGYNAAYTFDAGPNAVLYLRREHVPEVLALVDQWFPKPESADPSEYYGRAAEFLPKADPAKVGQLASSIRTPKYPAGSIRRIISTPIGDGPRILAAQHEPLISLLNSEGLPKRTV
ncbi:diphosphomevalonate decarboxylase [Polychytrium aggregatum]|uniref:diphosphomevalonate decarboxylase n=1 Tax=Polychytrium aggregatum TaxID=110093 RepID=UPI0022FDDD3F|nr:diphosphomevalonate decarboxylase [Polychytrium aggregatum]KAI9208824.1 diphosphomevalonate decarboxylase [Polychytrium aggregatum]